MGEAIASATRYTLELQRSRFTVQAFASGMLSGFAHSPTFVIRDFKGELQFVAATGTIETFELIVRSDSLELTDTVRDADRLEIQRIMKQDVLESQRYPDIEFRSTEIAANKIADSWYRETLRGEMRLHGVANRQEIDAQLRISEDGLRLSGEFPLLQSAYKIKRASGLGGMIKVKDELKFVFDLIARPSEQAGT